MQNEIDTLVQMSTPGPWSVKRSVDHHFLVLAGSTIVATCNSSWDAEMIVHLFNKSHEIQDLLKERDALLQKVNDLEDKIESLELKVEQE